jgi:hypothetical protein
MTNASAKNNNIYKSIRIEFVIVTNYIFYSLYIGIKKIYGTV